jgi:hypothetical protein
VGVAVFVNSSDGFQDCWPPFFELFSRFGGRLRDWPIYLNTERANYSWPNLNLTATRVWPQDEPKRPTWSECLIRGLDAVKEEYVLYLQEDYFLSDTVRDPLIDEAMEILQGDPEIGVTYLGRFGPEFTKSHRYKGAFVNLARPVRYLVSTQAAIWRKEFLNSLVRPWENGWMFEKFSSGRARSRRNRFLSISHAFRHEPAVDYIFTGIMKGRWNADCPVLFKRYGIQTDFSRRGFYRNRGRLKSRCETAYKLLASPRGALRSLASLSDPAEGSF